MLGFYRRRLLGRLRDKPQHQDCLRPRHRRLQAEWLEQRTLLSVSPTGFGEGTGSGFSLQADSQPPIGVDLIAASDTGISDTDNITNLDNSAPDKTLQFEVSGTLPGATVTLYVDATPIGTALASGPTTIITTDGAADLADGSRSITARQTESGEEESGDSPALGVTVDTAAPVHVGQPEQIDRLLAEDARINEGLGSSVSISGNMAIIGASRAYDNGAHSGAAYIFEYTGTGWTQVTRLIADSGAGHDYFGRSVAISGSTAIVGAYADDSMAGAAYIFEDTGSGWAQVAKLTTAHRYPDTYFGTSVSISDDRVIVGTNVGSAFVFEDTGTGWNQVAQLSVGPGSSDAYFGRSVSISGTSAIVGAYGDEYGGSYSGAAYIFEDTGSGWHRVNKLTADDGTEYDFFGHSVSIRGDMAIVGGTGGGDEGSGSAYIFEDTGSDWAQVAKLTASDADGPDYFGDSVSISGSMAVVGAYRDDHTGQYSGSAYLFEDAGSGWTEVSKLTADDGAERDFFGISVSISNGTAIVGVSGDDHNDPDAGAACVFGRTAQLTDDTGANLGDRVTSDTTPELTLTFSEVVRGQGSDVTVLDPNGDPMTPDSISGWGSNTLTVAFTTPLTVDGEYTVTLNGASTITDAAGNPLNGGVDETVTFTIDTAPPAAPATPDLQADSDRGISDSDNLTSDDSPTFDVSGAPYYRVYRDGTQISGDYEIGSYTAWGQQDGTFEYTVTAVDAAGNESAPSDAVSVTIFTVRPAQPGALDLQTASDTGLSDGDNITGDGTPTFDVSATPYFRVYRDGTQISDDVETGSGYTPAPQSDGIYEYSVSAVDAAGNVSLESDALVVTIDATPPDHIGQPERIAKLLAGDGESGDSFGGSVSISGDTAVVGAYHDADNGFHSGSAYIFEDTGSGWAQVAKLIPDDGAEDDYFGCSVAISGSTAIVGAYADDDDGNYSGSAYMFEKIGSSWTQIAKLTAEDTAAGDHFGYSVSISGSTVIVGAYYDDDNGSAYIFEDTGSGWNQVAKLTADDGAASDYFGYSVSISGSAAIVGAYRDEDYGSLSGSAYIFEDNGTSWNQVAKLTADDGERNDEFGYSVSISGNTAIVGAHGDDDNGVTSGSAYVFKDTDSGWKQVTKLSANDGERGDRFGYSVAINGSKALVGAYGDEDNGVHTGSAYVFEDIGTGWPQVAKLTDRDGSAYAYSGRSVSISDGKALVGADGCNGNEPNSGLAHVLGLGARVSDDTGLSHDDRLTNDTTPAVTFAFAEAVYGQDTDITITGPDGNPVVPDSVSGWGSRTLTVSFSTPLTMDGEYTVSLDGTDGIADTAGNPLNSGADETATFTLDTAAPVTPTTPDLQAASDRGVSSIDNLTNDTTPTSNVNAVPYFRFYRDGIRVSGEYESGTSYTPAVQADGTYDYTVNAVDAAGNESAQSDALTVTIDTVPAVEVGAFEEEAKLTAGDGAANDYFGRSVSISGSVAVVGAYYDDDKGLDSGSAYIFQDGGAGWNQVAKLTADDGTEDDRFGCAASISGSVAIIGAPFGDGNSLNTGSAYIFENVGSGWTQVAKLTANDGAEDDLFGLTVSISGTTAIIGASGDDDDGSLSGSAYIFEDTGSGWGQVAKLHADDAAELDIFGASVSISDRTAIVGAKWNDDDGSFSGSAYIFEDTGLGWNQVAKLNADDGAAYDNFGYSVSISGSAAIVGAYGDDDNGWDSGSAYIFEGSGSGWNQVAKLTADDSATNDEFGVSVAISGRMAVVGASWDDDNGYHSGSAYIFEEIGSNWTQVAKLKAKDGAESDYLGTFVSISGDTAIVGAPYDDDDGTDSGSAYIERFAPQLTGDTGAGRGDRVTSDTTPELTLPFTEPVFGQDSSVAALDPDGNPLAPGSISGWGSDTLTLAFSTPLAVDGDYTVTLDGTIIDAAGNAFNDGVSKSSFFTLDTTAPVTTIEFAVGDPSVETSVTVTATDAVSGVPNGTEVHLDVDLNNDLDFLDAGEASYAVSNLAGGTTTFDLLSYLEAGTYRFRARVVDVAGNEGVSATKEMTIGASLEPTDGADTIAVWPGTPGGAFHRVTINGTVTTYDPAVVSAILIDALTGADTIIIHGTDQDETVTLQPGSADVVGQTYELHVSNVESITIDGGAGNDQANLTGSTGTNRFYSYVTHATLTDSARSFSHRVKSFETLEVDASAGARDYAFLYDTPGSDRFEANAAEAVLTRGWDLAEPQTSTVQRFERVYAYATAESDDTALLTGASDARNRFSSYPNRATLMDLNGSFHFYARGFDEVTAQAIGDETSYAYLYDSTGADIFSATPDSAEMDRAIGSDATATGFARVYAYSTRGGDDTALLTGAEAGGNQYRRYASHSTLTDAARTFYHYARGFASLTAEGSQTDPTGDRAYLYDSPGDDTLTPTFLEDGEYQGAHLTDAGGTYESWIKYFDLVYARSADRDSNDTVKIEPDDDLAYALLLYGTW